MSVPRRRVEAKATLHGNISHGAIAVAGNEPQSPLQEAEGRPCSVLPAERYANLAQIIFGRCIVASGVGWGGAGRGGAAVARGDAGGDSGTLKIPSK